MSDSYDSFQSLLNHTINLSCHLHANPPFLRRRFHPSYTSPSLHSRLRRSSVIHRFRRSHFPYHSGDPSRVSVVYILPHGKRIEKIGFIGRWCCLFCGIKWIEREYIDLVRHWNVWHAGFVFMEVEVPQDKEKKSGIIRGTIVERRAVKVQINWSWWQKKEHNVQEWTMVAGEFWESRGDDKILGLSVKIWDKYVTKIWAMPQQEVDDSWRLHEKDTLLCEYSDTHPQEVLLMAMWNRFVPKFGLFADHQVERALRMFAREHRAVIRKLQLGDVFLLHMDELYRRGLASRHSIIAASEEVLTPGGQVDGWPILEAVNDRFKKLHKRYGHLLLRTEDQ